MTSTMNKVTCSLCNIKVDEIKWNEQLVSMNHLQLFKDNKGKNAIKFFEMIFNACPNEKQNI